MAHGIFTGRLTRQIGRWNSSNRISKPTAVAQFRFPRVGVLFWKCLVVLSLILPFTAIQRSTRPRDLARRKRNRTLGRLRLRLHPEIGSTITAYRKHETNYERT